MWFQDRRERNLSETTGPPDRPNFQLPSDMHLLDDPETLRFVREFAADQDKFFAAFSSAYLRMVSIGAPAAVKVPSFT
jgi:catalase (peroxidase I)